MGYIDELRKLVGNQPLILVGAATLILNEANQLLMIRRTDNQCWGIPGGAMEPGEFIEETAKRETLEETGLSVIKMHLYGVFSGPELYYQYPNGAEVYNITVVFLAREIQGQISLDLAEHSEHCYFALENLPKDISPPIKSILLDLVTKLTV